MPKTILWGGLICGGMDISAAFIDVGVNFNMGPVRLLQNVAGALLGPATYEGGLATAALGLAMHFTVAYSWTAIFYLLSRRFPLLTRPLRWRCAASRPCPDPGPSHNPAPELTGSVRAVSTGSR